MEKVYAKQDPEIRFKAASLQMVQIIGSALFFLAALINLATKSLMTTSSIANRVTQIKESVNQLLNQVENSSLAYRQMKESSTNSKMIREIIQNNITNVLSLTQTTEELGTEFGHVSTDIDGIEEAVGDN